MKEKINKVKNETDRFAPVILRDNQGNIHIRIILSFMMAAFLIVGLAYIQYEITASKMGKQAFASQEQMVEEQVRREVALYIDDLSGAEATIRKLQPDITDEEMKDQLEEILRIKMYSSVYNETDYPWVNEIIDFAGGDQYAIRLIHPNLKETEGSYLSTNTLDDVGNKPYLEELEGIKKDGEILHTYDFQVKSGEVKTKVTYSKLYPKYNWVISVGISLDTLDKYQDATRKELAPTVIGTTVVIEFVLLMVFFVFYYRSMEEERKSNNHVRNKLQERLEIDSLTGAKSRAFGVEFLQDVFEQYQTNGENSFVCVIDIDDFKDYNDNYGHDFGDEVLQAFVKEIHKGMRDSDVLIRYGGDEFILVVPAAEGLDKEKLGSRLMHAVENITLSADGQSISVSCSMGITMFGAEDDSLEQALKRADEAMYQAKDSGKKQFR